jgi:hypothetical protein
LTVLAQELEKQVEEIQQERISIERENTVLEERILQLQMENQQWHHRKAMLMNNSNNNINNRMIAFQSQIGGGGSSVRNNHTTMPLDFAFSPSSASSTIQSLPALSTSLSSGNVATTGMLSMSSSLLPNRQSTSPGILLGPTISKITTNNLMGTTTTLYPTLMDTTTSLSSHPELSRSFLPTAAVTTKGRSTSSVPSVIATTTRGNVATTDECRTTTVSHSNAQGRRLGTSTMQQQEEEKDNDDDDDESISSSSSEN